MPVTARIPLIESEYWDHALILSHFVKWLEGGKKPATEAEDNLQCCALVFAAIESIQSGKAVDVQDFYRHYTQELR